MHQSTTPSLSQTIWPRWVSRQFLTLPIVETLLPVTFGYSLSKEAVIMRQLRRWKRLWRRSLTRSHKRTSMESSRSCWNGTTRALQLEEITSKETRVSCVYYQYRCPYEKSLETYLMILVYWLFDNEKVSEAAVSEAGHTGSLLEHQRIYHNWFAWKMFHIASSLGNIRLIYWMTLIGIYMCVCVCVCVCVKVWKNKVFWGWVYL